MAIFIVFSMLLLRIFDMSRFMHKVLFIGFVIMLHYLHAEGSSMFVCSADHLHILITVRRVYVRKST